MSYNLLTYYEYRYKVEGGVFTTWSTLSNLDSTDNGDGTIKIRNLNYNIPIGDFEVRVKALNGNPPSLPLSNAEAFISSGVLILEYLDDFIDNIKAGYSTTKLFSFSTLCCKIRRDSDDVESDFGFVNNTLDEESILTFLGESEGFVTTWYDQTGNGSHFTQSIEIHQPKISFDTVHSKPALDFNGTSHKMEATNIFDDTFDKSFAFFTACNKRTLSASYHECILREVGGGYYVGSTSGDGFSYTLPLWTSGNFLDAEAYKINIRQPLLLSMTYDNTNIVAWCQNAPYKKKVAIGESDVLGLRNGIVMGALGSENLAFWDGEIMCKIYMNAALTEEQTIQIGNKIGSDFNMIEDLPHIMFEGNSLTAGFNSSSDPVTEYPGFSYPSQLVELVGGLSQLTFTNQGMGGGTIESIDAYLSPRNIWNTNGFTPKNIVLFWEGRNSMNNGDSAIQAFDAMIAYLDKYKALNYKIAVLTCLPTKMDNDYDLENAYGVSTNSFETQRLIYNQMIRDNVGDSYDYVIDIASDPLIGDLNNINDLDIWDAGGIHMTDLGYGKVAELAEPTLLLMLNA